MQKQAKQEQFKLINTCVQSIPDFDMKTGVGAIIQYRVVMPDTPNRPYWVLQRKPLKGTTWVDDLTGYSEELIQLSDAIMRRTNINTFTLDPWGWNKYMNWLNQSNMSDAAYETATTRFKKHMSIHCN